MKSFRNPHKILLRILILICTHLCRNSMKSSKKQLLEKEQLQGNYKTNNSQSSHKARNHSNLHKPSWGNLNDYMGHASENSER